MRSHRSEATKLSGARMPEQRRARELVHPKRDMLFGQRFGGETRRNLNSVLLRQFDNGFNK